MKYRKNTHKDKHKKIVKFTVSIKEKKISIRKKSYPIEKEEKRKKV